MLAVDHYNKVIDLLLENGITPFVTLYHWDLPDILQTTYTGILNKNRFVKDFAYFAENSFLLFGDRVKHWITFNEPVTECLTGYGTGEHVSLIKYTKLRLQEDVLIL